MTVFTFTEGNLQITIKGAIRARKFDDRNAHGLSHCMKAVDFVVERSDCYLFIEFKDPQHPRSRKTNRDKFIQEFQSGHTDGDLTDKYRDSFLYEWAAGREDKPVDYLVLIALNHLTANDLLTRTEALQRRLPLHGPQSGLWTRPIVRSCTVFNIASWNAYFPDYPINRVTP